MTRSRRSAVLAAAAHGMRGRPAREVARLLGVSERTVNRYWRRNMADRMATRIPEVLPDLDPRDLAAVARSIAGWAPDVEAALELADCLDVPRSAFADALAAIRVQQYAAPAAEVFTALHKVAKGTRAGLQVTWCGRVMRPDELWQFLEAADGDPVCPACLGQPGGHSRQPAVLGSELPFPSPMPVAGAVDENGLCTRCGQPDPHACR